MSKIIGTLADRKGNVLPNTDIVLREANNPTGDQAAARSDKFGGYSATVGLTNVEYDIWIEVQTTKLASNYIGSVISSGDSVSSFSLCGDASWKVEHWGDDGPPSCGTHKATVHDSIALRAGGFVETADTFFEFRVGGTNQKLQIKDIGDTFFFDPTIGSNAHIGLSEGGAASADFYFGSTKTYKINTFGVFVLGAGSFGGAVSFAEQVTFAKRATFAKSSAEYPQLVSYVGASDNPTADNHLAPKAYVDSEIISNLPAGNIIQEDDSYVLVDDDGISPGAVIVGIDGSVYSRAITPGYFGFGSSFTPNEVIHLKKNNVSLGVKIERSGTGAATSRLDETSVGSVTNNDFFFKTNGINAGVFDNLQRLGVGVFSGLTEKLNIGGNIRLQNNLHLITKGTPSNPALEEAKIFLRTQDANNNELVALIKKKVAGSAVIDEVVLTSPEGMCRVCKEKSSAKDPYFDTVKGKMIIELRCGHKFEMNMNYVQVEN